MRKTYLNTFITILLVIAILACAFNLAKAQVAPTATLTRWVVGSTNLMALEFNGVGRELYVNWNGQETFYHNDTNTEYTIIRTTIANTTTAKHSEFQALTCFKSFVTIQRFLRLILMVSLTTANISLILKSSNYNLFYLFQLSLTRK